MKHRKIWALGALLALALTGCAGQAAPAGSTAGETTKLTLCLDWTPNTNHTGFYVAQALGYFQEEGLEVSIVQPPEDGAKAICAAGQVEFAVSAQDTTASLYARPNPIQITAVAALIQHNTSGIMARAGEGLDRPAGLEGKVYSTWNTPTEMAMMEQVVTADGGDFSKVTLIPNVITDEAAGLAAKQTDALWVFYGWGGISAQVRGIAVDYWNFSDIDPIFDYYTPVLFANDDFLKDQPEVAKAFLRAVTKGYEYAIQNPEQAAQILIDGDETGSLRGSEELVTASQQWLAGQYQADAARWGEIDAARWDGFYAWLWDNGLVDQEIPAGTGFSNDYLPQ